MEMAQPATSGSCGMRRLRAIAVPMTYTVVSILQQEYQIITPGL
jgi:hypothetical protein